MLDKNDLLAIAELMDSKLESNNTKLKQDIMTDVNQLRQDIMTDANKLRQDMTSDISKLRQDMLTEIRQTRVLIENQSHSISLIAEQYGDIAQKLEKLVVVDELKDRVRILERTASIHTDEIAELKKA